MLQSLSNCNISLVLIYWNITVYIEISEPTFKLDAADGKMSSPFTYKL